MIGSAGDGRERVRKLGVVMGSLAVGGTLAAVFGLPARHVATNAWPERGLSGATQIHGEVPLPVERGIATYVRRHSPGAVIRLNFGFPLRDRAALDRLIEQQAKTHTSLSRSELYDRFTPPVDQVDALRQWLAGAGFQVTHVGLDRMAVTA